MTVHACGVIAMYDYETGIIKLHKENTKLATCYNFFTIL